MARAGMHTAQSAPERDLADLDALTEADLFRGLSLADLLSGRDGPGPPRARPKAAAPRPTGPAWRLSRSRYPPRGPVRRPPAALHFTDRLGGSTAALWLGRGYPDWPVSAGYHAVTPLKVITAPHARRDVSYLFPPRFLVVYPSWFRRRFGAGVSRNITARPATEEPASGRRLVPRRRCRDVCTPHGIQPMAEPWGGAGRGRP